MSGIKLGVGALCNVVRLIHEASGSLAFRANHRNEKTRGSRGFDGQRWADTDSLVPPQGLERVPETRGKTGSGVLVPPRVPPSVAILESGAEELLAIWSQLNAIERADLLEAARRFSYVGQIKN